MVGLTSATNRAFCESLGCYHRVLAYEELEQLPAQPASVYVDFAGSVAPARAHPPALDRAGLQLRRGRQPCARPGRRRQPAGPARHVSLPRHRSRSATLTGAPGPERPGWCRPGNGSALRCKRRRRSPGWWCSTTKAVPQRRRCTRSAGRPGQPAHWAYRHPAGRDEPIDRPGQAPAGGDDRACTPNPTTTATNTSPTPSTFIPPSRPIGARCTGQRGAVR